MNVLLTRAKCAMIVFGNKRTLISNDLWKNWINSVPNINAPQFVNDCLITNDQSQSTNQRRQNGNNDRRRRRQ